MKKPSILTGDCKVFVDWFHSEMLKSYPPLTLEEALQMDKERFGINNFYLSPAELVRGEEPNRKNYDIKRWDYEASWDKWAKWKCVFEGEFKEIKPTPHTSFFDKIEMKFGKSWVEIGKVGDTHEQIISNCKELEIQLRWKDLY